MNKKIKLILLCALLSMCFNVNLLAANNPVFNGFSDLRSTSTGSNETETESQEEEAGHAQEIIVHPQVVEFSDTNNELNPMPVSAISVRTVAQNCIGFILGLLCFCCSQKLM